MTTICNKLYSNDNDKEEEILLQPFNYAASITADNRKSLTIFWGIFNEWLDIPEEKLQEIFDVLDDIQDNSVNRNGSPTTHTIFGRDRTLNAINYVNVLTGEKILGLKSPAKFVDIYIREGMNFYKGQGMEIYWRDNYICPTEEEYLKMIKYKSKGALALGVCVMQLFSDNKSDFTRIMEISGDFIQIYNDYINLGTPKYVDFKCYGDDITEGKFSFPIIHAIQSHPEDEQIMNIMKMRTTDIEIKKYCVSLMVKYGSFEYTRHFLEDLRSKSIEEMKKLGDNPSMKQIFDRCLNKLNELPVMI